MTSSTWSRRGRRLVAATAVAPLVALAAAGGAGASSAPLTWTFDKCAVSGGTWEGTATRGGTTEGLRTELTGLDETGSVWHVTFDWHVGTRFVAPLRGTLNLNTGAVVMNGTVARGEHTGSQVHEEGQLYDPQRLCFAGSITVLPAT